MRSVLRTDLASIRRDPLLVLIGLSPLLLGAGLRVGYPPARLWLAEQHGFDLDPYRPLLLAVGVLLHVPVTFGMIGALLVLDDLDDRALTALRTSPLTLPRYLGYRAGLVAPLFMLGTLALAQNKVEGVSAVKLLGLPSYAPVAAWWLTGPGGWFLAAVPTWWVVQVLWLSWPYALGWRRGHRGGAGPAGAPRAHPARRSMSAPGPLAAC